MSDPVFTNEECLARARQWARDEEGNAHRRMFYAVHSRGVLAILDDLRARLASRDAEVERLKGALAGIRKMAMNTHLREDGEAEAAFMEELKGECDTALSPASEGDK